MSFVRNDGTDVRRALQVGDGAPQSVEVIAQAADARVALMAKPSPEVARPVVVIEAGSVLVRRDLAAALAGVGPRRDDSLPLVPGHPLPGEGRTPAGRTRLSARGRGSCLTSVVRRSMP